MTICSFISWLATTILNPLLYILFSAALIVFIWGLIKFLNNPGKEYGQGSGSGFQSRADAKRIMGYGLAGLFVMLTATSIIGLAVNTFFPGHWPPSASCSSASTPTTPTSPLFGRPS